MKKLSIKDAVDKTKKIKKLSKKSRTILIVGVIAVVFIVSMILMVFGKKKTDTKNENFPTVVVQKPVRQNLVESVNITGYIEANAMIPVVPFVSGTIVEYPIVAGDFVKKDQLLAKIDDAPFRQQFIQAQAAYLGTDSSYKRIKSLYEAGATTQQNYDTAKAQYDATKAQYDLAKLQLDYTEVRAPVSGTVLIADMAVGSIGNQQQPVAVLADLSNLVVRLKVPEKYFDLFTLQRKNLVVTVTRPAEKDKYEDAVASAVIKNIAPYVSPESKNFQVVCKLEDPGERFRPGMFVKVQVAYNVHENVLTLPVQTKKMDGSLYIYDEATQSVKYIEKIDSVTDGQNFIVGEEYENTYFVIDGQNFIYDGQKVKIYSEALSEFGIDESALNDDADDNAATADSTTASATATTDTTASATADSTTATANSTTSVLERESSTETKSESSELRGTSKE